jgi:hypothetical protein
LLPLKIKLITKTMAETNPEALHNIGQSQNVQTTPKIWNVGTPANALVSEADLVKAEVSKDASAKLSENLIKR